MNLERFHFEWLPRILISITREKLSPTSDIDDEINVYSLQMNGTTFYRKIART